MPLSDLLAQLLVEPLMLLYDGLFTSLVELFGSYGLAIVGFGVVLNTALTPLYAQMERNGRASREKRAAMNKEIERIKTHFSGRERYYYVTTIHRHYGYRPISVVYSSMDLYLQVFAFVTVYRYLSGLGGLSGVSFWFIPDLSRPDGLLFGFNLLPFVMTAANLASTLAYAADATRRRNAFLLALLFLVLLYRSPSALLVYWTVNNLYSLVRNLAVRHVGRALPQVQEWFERELVKP